MGLSSEKPVETWNFCARTSHSIRFKPKYLDHISAEVLSLQTGIPILYPENYIHNWHVDFNNISQATTRQDQCLYYDQPIYTSNTRATNVLQQQPSRELFYLVLTHQIGNSNNCFAFVSHSRSLKPKMAKSACEVAQQRWWQTMFMAGLAYTQCLLCSSPNLEDTCNILKKYSW